MQNPGSLLLNCRRSPSRLRKLRWRGSRPVLVLEGPKAMRLERPFTNIWREETHEKYLLMHESQFVLSLLYSMRNKNISNVICLFYGYVGSCLHFRTKQHSQPWPLTIPHQCLLNSQQLYFPNRENYSRLYSCVLQRERLLYFIAGRYYMLPYYALHAKCMTVI